VADFFADRVYYGGLTYSAHPMSCAAAIAAINVLRDDDQGAAPDLAGLLVDWPATRRGAVRTSACSRSSSSSETRSPGAIRP
jgi:taurine--2-oxoglutarate transaminase